LNQEERGGERCAEMLLVTVWPEGRTRPWHPKVGAGLQVAGLHGSWEQR